MISPVDPARGPYLLHDAKGRNEQARGDGGESPNSSAEIMSDKPYNQERSIHT